jgi:hypothetical protein
MRRLALIMIFGFLAVLFLMSVTRATILTRIDNLLGIPNASYLHAPAFFMLTLLLTYLCRSYSLELPLMASFAFATLFAVLIELLQFFIPYRSAQWTDLMLGFAGILGYCMLDYFVSLFWVPSPRAE